MWLISRRRSEPVGRISLVPRAASPDEIPGMRDLLQPAPLPPPEGQETRWRGEAESAQPSPRRIRAPEGP